MVVVQVVVMVVRMSKVVRMVRRMEERSGGCRKRQQR